MKTALAPTPSEQPTIIAPKDWTCPLGKESCSRQSGAPFRDLFAQDYAARFMRAMSTYFVADCPEEP